MKMYNHWRTRKNIRKTAKVCGQTVTETRAEMQEAIDAAWANEDPEAIAYRDRLFPNGKPTIEEFIAVIAAETKKQMR